MPTPEVEEVEDPVDKGMKEQYYNAEDPASYGGVEKVFRNAKKAGVQKVTRGRVKQFLADKHSYSVHKPVRRTSSATLHM